jgi:hypothetical protein
VESLYAILADRAKYIGKPDVIVAAGIVVFSIELPVGCGMIVAEHILRGACTYKDSNTRVVTRVTV